MTFEKWGSDTLKILGVNMVVAVIVGCIVFLVGCGSQEMHAPMITEVSCELPLDTDVEWEPIQTTSLSCVFDQDLSGLQARVIWIDENGEAIADAKDLSFLNGYSGLSFAVASEEIMIENGFWLALVQPGEGNFFTPLTGDDLVAPLGCSISGVDALVEFTDDEELLRITL